jgi:citronellyl-CoA synthetase
MAAVTLKEGVDKLDLTALSEFVNNELPAYARPVFIRVQPDIDVTGTFKMVKGDLRKQAYDLAQVDDPLYVLMPRQDVYQPLTEELHTSIKAGQESF